MVYSKWIASLSNGTTWVEGTKVEDTNDSPWTHLQKYLEANKLHITGMRVQVSRDGEAVRTYHMPTMGNINKDGRHVKWRFMRPILPLGYKAVRGEGAPWGGEAIEEVIRCEAEFPDMIVSLVVDVLEGTNSWVVIHEKG